MSIQDFDFPGARPWFEIACFNELAGSGLYRSEIGDVDDSNCYVKDSNDSEEDSEFAESSIHTFSRNGLDLELIEWIAGRAFLEIRSEIFVWPDGTDPLVNCFMEFLASQAVERDYVGLSTALRHEDSEGVFEHQTTHGFAASLTWRFTRDPDLQTADLHRTWHILKDAFPNLPVAR